MGPAEGKLGGNSLLRHLARPNVFTPRSWAQQVGEASFCGVQGYKDPGCCARAACSTTHTFRVQYAGRLLLYWMMPVLFCPIVGTVKFVSTLKNEAASLERGYSMPFLVRHEGDCRVHSARAGINTYFAMSMFPLFARGGSFWLGRPNRWLSD